VYWVEELQVMALWDMTRQRRSGRLTEERLAGCNG